jgi:multidrug efflux pump subunit AcrB
MKKIISYFIKFPVAVNIVVIAFFIFGILGFNRLNSSFFPIIPTKIISIQIVYPGASPEEIEEGIVIKIEDNLKGLTGIDRVTSVSRENSGTITVEILKGFNIDVILQDVKNAVDMVPSYPAGMEPLVVYKKENLRETISFTVSGEGVDLRTLKQIAREIENDLRKLDGISQVEITGYPEEEIEIAVRENDLLAYNLTYAEVASAVASENILVTGGTIKTASEEYLIRVNNRSYHAAEIDHIVVKTDARGDKVRLKDVAEVRDIFEDMPDATYFNGKIAVNISISNTDDEDLLSSAEKINNYVKEFNQKYNNIQLDVVSDSSITLSERTKLLMKNAFQGMILVLIFLSIFLNTRMAFWVAFGLPISFLGMFAFASLFGVTINVLSLFGMIIVIGILVDDGIVIAENIYHHFEKGKGPIRAAIDGTLEVVPPVISAIITTVLAFSTFLFLEGRIGEFWGELAVIVILTLVISLLEAFIILPAHIAHSDALKKLEKDPSKQNVITRIFARLRDVNKVGDRMMKYMRDTLYSPLLTFGLKYRLLAFSVLFAFLVLTMGSISGGIIGTTFFPSIASDRVTVNLSMPQGTNVAITDSIISMIEERVWEINEDFTARQKGNKQVVENVIKRIGPGTSTAQLSVNLLPGEERGFSSFEIANSIRDAVGPVYGVENLTFSSGGNFGGASPVSVSLLSNNIAELKGAKNMLKEMMSLNPNLKDITDNDPEGIKEIRIELNDKAFLLGLTTSDVISQVRSGFFGYQVQRIQRGEDEVRVWIRFDEETRSSIQNLDQMRILTPQGERVPFMEIASYVIERGDVVINHLDGQREIQVNADLSNPGEGAMDALEDIKARIMPQVQARFPSVSALYEGQNREANKLTSSAAKAFPMILFLIYAVIAFTFRSYSQPLLLIALVPFSLIGIAWGHWIHGFPINILSFLGIIALIGIMVNDGLVLIEKFNRFLKDGLSFDEALYQAGRSRFRAIFLTSLTTIMGMVPLIFETSRQAQFLKPMAISISYGIGIATVLTLLLLPIYLSFVNSVKVFFKWLFTGKEVSREEVERIVIEKNSNYDDLEE